MTHTPILPVVLDFVAHRNAKPSASFLKALVFSKSMPMSDEAETEGRFNASMIKGAKVAFRPGIDLKEMLATLKYEKVK